MSDWTDPTECPSPVVALGAIPTMIGGDRRIGGYHFRATE